MHKPQEKYWIGLVYLGLMLSTLAVYWQVRNFEFTSYDDTRYVSENNHILSGLTRENIVWVFTHKHHERVGHWHPLTGLSHMLDCELFGLNPGPHHLVNLLFHIVNALLLFTVLRQMTGAFWQSAFVAGLFAVHPMNAESVAWVSERKNVLSTLFWILTMAAYFRYVKSPATARYVLTLVLFTLGLMAKSMLVTMPFVLLLLDYWPLNRLELNDTGKINWRLCRRLIWEKIPFFVLSAVFSAITFYIHKSGGYVIGTEALPLTIRIYNAVASYARYIEKMIWPAKLAMLYSYYLNVLPLWLILTAALLLSIITVLVIRFGAKYRYLPVGWFWYVGTLVPVIGLVQVCTQTMADRYSYVPFIGLFIMVAWGANDLLKKWRYRKAVLAASAAAVIMVLSVCTWIQTGYWRNSISLYEHAIKVTSGNYVAHYDLGIILIGQSRYDDAVSHLRLAIKYSPDFALAYNYLGVAYNKLGRYQDAIEPFKEAIRIKPNYAEAYNNLGAAYLYLRRCGDVIELSKQAVKNVPDYHMIYNNLGAAYYMIGRYPEAIVNYRLAIKLKPDFAMSHYNLGLTFVAAGKTDSALAEYEILKTLDAERANKLLNLIGK